MILDHRGDERLLRREAPEDRRVPDAGSACDLVDADVGAVLGERLGCGVEHAGQVPLRVGSQRRHVAGTGSVARLGLDPGDVARTQGHEHDDEAGEDEDGRAGEGPLEAR